MNSRNRWSRFVIVIGGLAMLLGTVDPLEGSVLIVLGSGLVALGMALRGKARNVLLYWTSAFFLIAVGVSAMFALSAIGGFGGTSGLSMWWGVLLLPYLAGWLMAVVGGVAGLVRFLKARRGRR
jgi:hypothetical protein